MDERCLPTAALGDLCAAGPDDPRWRHVDACPRCRALVAAYRRFQAGTPAWADPAAEDELGRRVTAALAGTAAGNRARRPGRGNGRVTGIGLAAAAVLATVLVLGRGERGGPPPVVVRGPVAASVLRVAPPRLQEDGGLVLSWGSCPGADGYRIVLLDEALAPLASWPAGADTSLTLPPSARVGGVYWQVEARSGGAVLARSAPDLVGGP